MSDRVRLLRERASDERSVRGLVLLLAVTAAALALRSAWTPAVPEGLLVEVRGQVARPGVHVVQPPTLAAAVEAAGGVAEGLSEQRLLPGDAVEVGPDGVRILPMGDPRLVALPVDVNVAPVEALAAVPGVGQRGAEAIVRQRMEAGAFHGLDEVAKVRGVDPEVLRSTSAMLTVGAVGPRPPLDVNRASAAALEALPGVGPALAGRIVASRDADGPFRDADDLLRVNGVGPALLDRLRPLVVAR